VREKGREKPRRREKGDERKSLRGRGDAIERKREHKRERERRCSREREQVNERESYAKERVAMATHSPLASTTVS